MPSRAWVRWLNVTFRKTQGSDALPHGARCRSRRMLSDYSRLLCEAGLLTTAWRSTPRETPSSFSFSARDSDVDGHASAGEQFSTRGASARATFRIRGAVAGADRPAAGWFGGRLVWVVGLTCGTGWRCGPGRTRLGREPIRLAVCRPSEASSRLRIRGRPLTGRLCGRRSARSGAELWAEIASGGIALGSPCSVGSGWDLSGERRRSRLGVG
jgi:hypothetical protein